MDAFAFTLAFACVLTLSVAHADVPPTTPQGCKGLTVGKACNIVTDAGQLTGQTGVCVMTMECGTWVACGPGAPVPVCPDASAQPGSSWQPQSCLVCKPVDAGTAGAGGTAGEAGTAGASGQAGAVALGGAAGATIAAGSAGSPPAESDDGACSLGGRDANKTFGPWLLSGSAAVLLLFGRRRRRG
jgi:hypothetical protein